MLTKTNKKCKNLKNFEKELEKKTKCSGDIVNRYLSPKLGFHAPIGFRENGFYRRTMDDDGRPRHDSNSVVCNSTRRSYKWSGDPYYDYVIPITSCNPCTTVTTTTTATTSIITTIILTPQISLESHCWFAVDIFSLTRLRWYKLSDPHPVWIVVSVVQVVCELS